MYQPMNGLDVDKIGKAVSKVADIFKDVKKAGTKAKDDIAKNVADQVTPKVASATVLAAVLGSGVMLALALVFLRKK